MPDGYTLSDAYIKARIDKKNPENGDKCIGYKMVNGKKKLVYWNKEMKKAYYIGPNDGYVLVETIHDMDGFDFDSDNGIVFH